MKVTEEIIAKAGLSDQEKRVARVFFKIETGGKRTQKWVDALSDRKRNHLLSSAQEKIQQTLETQRAGR